MTELLKDKSCLQNSTVLRVHSVHWNEQNVTRSNITFEQGDACKDGDNCCITTPTKDNMNRLIKDMYQHLPDSTNWMYCYKYNDGECEECLGVGASDWVTCFTIPLRTSQDDAFYYNEYLTCSDGYYVASESNKHFERSIEGCTKEDKCCMRIASNQSQSLLGQDNYFRCNDPCRLHINYLTSHSKTIYDWTSWSVRSEYIQGLLVGGKVCSTNLTFGYSLLIPVFLNWLFVLKVWFSDFNNKMTSRRTFVFGLTSTYPIFLVVKYLRNWKDKREMNQQKERFEREVATAEGYIESILQVSDYLCII